MALRGIRVLEMAGLAPGPFCGMILADFGATVIRIDRVGSVSTDTLSRGKRSIAVDVRGEKGSQLVAKLASQVH
jgi:alpha-methylacyl-CoA racemase